MGWFWKYREFNLLASGYQSTINLSCLCIGWWTAYNRKQRSHFSPTETYLTKLMYWGSRKWYVITWYSFKQKWLHIRRLTLCLLTLANVCSSGPRRTTITYGYMYPVSSKPPAMEFLWRFRHFIKYQTHISIIISINYRCFFSVRPICI